MTTISSIRSPLLEVRRVLASSLSGRGLTPVIRLGDKAIDEYAASDPLPIGGEGTLLQITLERETESAPHLDVPQEWRRRIRGLTAYMAQNNGRFRLFEDGSGEIILSTPQGEVSVATFSSLVDLPGIDPGKLPRLEDTHEQPTFPGLRLSEV